MKAIQTLKAMYRNAMARAAVMLTMAPSAFAITRTDLTQDTSGGKSADDVMNNIDQTVQGGATLLISIVSIGGFIVVALSLYTLYKSSKDEREKPMSAIVGLFIGGLMAGVGTVMWIMRNTTIGT